MTDFELIDSHCHLLGFKTKGELEPVLERAAAAGVQRFITVGTGLKDWVPYREMSAANPGKIDYTVGLHPCYVDAEWNDAVAQLSTFFMPPHTPVALGEIGLDYFHLPKDPVEAGELMLHQEAAFRQQLSIASELDVPIIIHSRNAFDDTFRMIDESGVDWSRIVFHCYSYGPDEIAKINERGGRGSFTGIVTYKNAPEIRDALRQQGIERLMLETDCPYLTPEPHRGKPNEPAFVADIARRCAEALAVSEAELAARTTANTKAFFNLS
ncbi:MAG: TatD family hydrolase [Coraliomargarita sp.]